MAHDFVYMPILRGKEGEYAALEVLDDSVRSMIAPLIDIPEIPFDWAQDRPAKTLDAHLAGVADRLKRIWSADRPLYLHMPSFNGGSHLASGELAIESVLGRCRELELTIVPVVTYASQRPFLQAVGAHHGACGSGACLRLSPASFSEDAEESVEEQLEAFEKRLPEIELHELDLVLDLQEIRDVQQSLMSVRWMLGMMPEIQRWRRVIIAATSFPEDLRDVDAAAATKLPRLEWRQWTTLQRRPPRDRSDVIFGDYAIANPRAREIDPRTMRMSASVRYTTAEDWLIIKGRNVRQYGFEQYYDIAEALVARPEFSGADFSWGDDYIAKCARRAAGPGNATTWRKVGTNHHITLVTRQLATSADSSGAPAPSPPLRPG